MVNATWAQCVFIGSRQPYSCIPEDVVIKFDGTTISPSTHVKSPDLYMDRYMSFETRFNEISKKVTSMLFYINKISSYLDRKSKTVIVKSQVHSYFIFCLSIWAPPPLLSVTKPRSYNILQQELSSVALRNSICFLCLTRAQMPKNKRKAYL